MSTLFSRLFSAKAPANDGFTQIQREAVVDLLNFCSYADDKLALAEDAIVAKELEQCHWHPAEPVELFVKRSITRVRNALESPESRANFLADVSDRLAAPETRTRALSLSKRLFGADGDYSADEKTVFNEIEQAFGRPKGK
jgi:hypothetical protein